MKKCLAVAMCLSVVSAAQAAIRITEWMYNGTGAGSIGEFVELTNIGAVPIDLTGWSFDDSSRTPGSESLSALGILQPGESAIFTDNTEAAFRTSWNLPASVKILGGNTNNLGRNDEINIYNASNLLVDRLTYNDQSVPPGGPRTNGVSGWTTPANLGINDATKWQLSVVGDAQNSYTSLATIAEIGNPGTYIIPEPTAVLLLAAGATLLRRSGRGMRRA